MPSGYWSAIDQDRGNQTVSGWLQTVAEAHLAGKGVKIEDPRHLLVARFLSLIETSGPAAVSAKLDEMAAEVAQPAGVSS
jgi:hypothetical protein